MVIKFNNDYLEGLAKGESIKGKPKYDKYVVQKFLKVLKILQRTPNTHGLRVFHSLNFEALKGNMKGYYSVRVDHTYRLILTIENDLITISEIIIVEELTKHNYGLR